MDKGILAARRQRAVEKITEKFHVDAPTPQARYNTAVNELLLLEAIADADPIPLEPMEEGPETVVIDYDFDKIFEGWELVTELCRIQGIGEATARKIIPVVQKHIEDATAEDRED